MKNLKVTIGKTTKARSFESLSEKEKTSLHFKRVKKWYAHAATRPCTSRKMFGAVMIVHIALHKKIC